MLNTFQFVLNKRNERFVLSSFGTAKWLSICPVHDGSFNWKKRYILLAWTVEKQHSNKEL